MYKQLFGYANFFFTFFNYENLNERLLHDI